MQDDSDDELEAFTRKIRTLRDVSIDLKDVINTQNSRLKGLTPGMSGSLMNMQRLVRRLSNSTNKHFKGWLYYILASLFFCVAIFVLFILF